MDPELAKRADELTAAVDGLTRIITIVEKRDIRRRSQIIVLAASVLLDLGLSAGFFYSLDRTNENQTRVIDAQERASSVQEVTNTLLLEVKRANSASVSICNARNEQTEILEQILDVTFTQMDCERLGVDP